MERRLPFVLSRETRTDLITQVADGLRHAITTEYFKRDDLLPTIIEMADELGVSEIVTRRAVKRLTKEGIINPRRGLGIRVCGLDQKTWQGQILFVHQATDNTFYHSVVYGVVRDFLQSHNYLVQVVSVTPADRRKGYQNLRAELGRSISLAILTGLANGVDKVLAEKEIPFVHFARHISPLAVKGVQQHWERAVPQVIEHCRACNVHSVIQTHFEADVFDADDAFRQAGLSYQRLKIAPMTGFGRPESVVRGSMAVFAKGVPQIDGKPADLVLFDDDYVAQGAFLSFIKQGVRIPEDVQIITLSNKSLGPVFYTPLTRYEMRPEEHGLVLAKHALRFLDGKIQKKEADDEVGPVFIEGASTRVVGR